MKQYHDLLRHILATGTRHEDRTGVGTISAFGYQTRFDLREGFPIVTTKRVPFRWVAEELFWFLSGSTDEADLRTRGVDIWAEWATAEQTAEVWTEGRRSRTGLRIFVAFVRRRLSADEWRRPDRAAYPRDRDKSEFTPTYRHRLEPGNVRQRCVCRRVIRCFNSRSRTAARSIASFINVRPTRFSACRSISAAMRLLTHLVAHVCDLEVGEFIHTFGDVHIYSNHLEQVNELLLRDPMELPQLEFVNADKLKGLDGLLEFKYENLKFENYRSYGKIAAPVAV